MAKNTRPEHKPPTVTPALPANGPTTATFTALDQLQVLLRFCAIKRGNQATMPFRSDAITGNTQTTPDSTI